MMRIYLLILIFCLLIGCKQKYDDVFFPTQRLIRIFTDSLCENKDILLVITHSGCHVCDSYRDSIKNNQILRERLLKNYLCFECPANRIDFECLTQILYEASFPMTLICDKSGQVKALWKGTEISKMLYEISDSMSVKDIFFTNTNNKLFLADSNYITLISSTLKAYIAYIKNDMDLAASEIKKSLHNHEYFFNLYLAAKISQKEQDSLQAIKYASRTLYKNTEYDNLLYQNLMEEVSFIIGKERKYTAKPSPIAFKNKILDLGEIKLNSNCEFMVEYRNVDSVPVIINNIDKSCNCMEISWDSKPLFPKDIGYIKIKYDTSKLGFFTKILFININNFEPIQLYIKGIII